MTVDGCLTWCAILMSSPPISGSSSSDPLLLLMGDPIRARLGLSLVLSSVPKGFVVATGSFGLFF